MRVFEDIGIRTARYLEDAWGEEEVKDGAQWPRMQESGFVLRKY